MNQTATTVSEEQLAVRVSFEDVNLSFGKTHVLKGINLEIQPGELFAFLGPSGCGKTTLLRLLAGFESAQTGQVIIGDNEVSYLPPWQRDLGMVFQSYALWPHMTIRKNVAFGLEERKVPGHEIRERTDRALEMVGLLDLAERRPSQLSGGQQQRVALARTIVIEPKVLLLDEPLSNLDAKLRIQMRHELRDLQRKLSITTIFVTHDQEEANTIADRIALMKDGIIQQVGSPVELYDHPVNRFVADFLGTANFLGGHLEKTSNGWTFATDNDLQIPIKNSDDSFVPGRSCIVFRPQNVRVLQSSAKTTDDIICFPGTVLSNEFLGSTVRYRLAIKDTEIFADFPHQQGSGLLEKNQDVTLAIDGNQVRVVHD